ncbi:hypothetical protein A4R26_18230 [Niastella populi]|uniref:Secretin/TonB short N-terminal domain-containing protein n=2 Tax=Niastella populi TaxID=550983 RepID=A0A1V9FV36_9BACT|nr:hypothetical protein A4R26_18230 [Niastella populi]
MRDATGHALVNKLLRIMRLTAILLLGACLQVAAKGTAQSITLSEKNAPIEKVLLSIEKQANVSFYYKVELLQKSAPVTISVKNASLKQVLDICFKDKPFTYEIIGNVIVIKPTARNAIIQIEPVQMQADTTPNIDVRGRVIFSHSEPVPGATISVKGTSIATYTNKNGEFLLKHIDPKARLLISSVGMETIEAPVNGRSQMVVIARQKLSDLDQVQIIAYGATSKRLNTGDVTTITSEEIARNPVANVLQVLQYRVPGMFIQQQTGVPGGRFNVEIRGQSTFGNQAPLYIIDGVSYPAGTPLPYVTTSNIEGGSAGLQGGNALNFIDPSQIESVEVLKDADATSVYGSRGAYGVVIITTKKGKAHAPMLSLNVNQSISVRGTTPKMLNTEEYLTLRREAIKNSNGVIGATDYDLNGTWPEDRYTNWSKEFTGLYSPRTYANASYSGGVGNTTFLIRANYNDEKTTQRDKGSYRNMGAGFDINSGSANKKLTVGLSGSFSSTINDMKPWEFALGGLNTLAPNAPSLFLPDGTLNWETGDNPAKGLQLIFDRVDNNMLGNLRVEYRPVKNLSLVNTVGYNLITTKELRAEPTTYFNPNSAVSPSNLSNSTLLNATVRTITVEPSANYSMQAGGRGDFSVQAGATFQDILQNSSSVKGINFISDAMLYNPTFTTQANILSAYSQNPEKYAGFFGIAKFDWAHKYVLRVTGRYDGSSKFGPGNQWGLFGSAAFFWIFSEEPWFKKALPFISFGKVRVSHGTSGGDKIGNYLYLDRYTSNSSTYQGRIGLDPTSLANPDLHWEHTKKSQVTLDLGFMQDRFLLTAAYYRDRTSDQLVNQPLSTVTGFQAFQVNSPALLQNTGFEGTLTSHNMKRRNFNWTTNVVLTIPRSKLVEYPGFNLFEVNNNYVLGKSINGIRLYKYAGVDPQTGNYNFYKEGVKGEFLPLLGPVQLDPNKDKTEFVDFNPRYYGSINNSFQYKNLTFGFMVAIVNRMGRNFMGQQTFLPGVANRNTVREALGRWQKPGDITDIPKPQSGINALLLQNNFFNSTGAYANATYARLSNVNIAYDFSGKFLMKARIKALRVLLQGQNLLTVSEYKDLDPENLGAGQAPTRTFSAGINLSL